MISNIKSLLIESENFDDLIKSMFSQEVSKQDAMSLVLQKSQNKLNSLSDNKKQYKQVAKWFQTMSQIYANNNSIGQWKSLFTLLTSKYKNLTNFWNTLPNVVENPIRK